MIELLEQLCTLRSVSGDEERAARFITGQIDGFCEWRIDALGSVIAQKKGAQRAKNSVLLCAPLDEPGLIVTGHTDEGLLKFASVGKLDSRVLLGKPVLAGDAALPGVVGAKPIHMMTGDEKDTPLAVDKLLMDLGFSSRAEAEAAVCAGERAVFDTAFSRFGEGLLKGRAVGSRAACAALLALIRGELEYDMTFVFAAQSETGGVGAHAAAYSVAPHCAVAVESAPAADLTGVPDEKQICRLGAGPAFAFLDQGAAYDRELYQLGLRVAEESGILAQIRLGTAGSGAAKAMQTAHGGVRCASVGIPCRYLRTPCSVISEKDVENTVNLLRVFAARAAVL